MAINEESKILIVGAGCFGLSTAYHLLKRGFTSVTVLDRSAVLPAPDAASCDMNKVVRSSYSDDFYSQLARVAIDDWKTEGWGDTYHECGVVVLGSEGSLYVDYSYKNDVALGARVGPLGTAEDLRECFPSAVKTASFDGKLGYINRDGGWANAAQGVSILMAKVKSLGGSIIPGKPVASLLQQNGKTSGVRCADGSVYDADLVVLAAGSWGPSTFPELNLSQKCVATGQSIAFLQLTAEEAALYKDCPIVLDFGGTGFYMFPPNEHHVVKIALHASGHTHTPQTSDSFSAPPVSTPRTVLSHGDDGLRIPKDILTKLRSHLRGTYPDLAEKPFSGTRLCWYTDSPDDDWIIGFYPGDAGLMLATAGSGHAYKFLPVIGRLVADAIQGKLEPELVEKFAFGRQRTLTEEEARAGQHRFGETPQELDVTQLATLEDLLP